MSETSICCLPYPPDWGLNPQPKYVPWPGIEPETLRCPDNTLTNRANQAGLINFYLCYYGFSRISENKQTKEQNGMWWPFLCAFKYGTDTPSTLHSQMQCFISFSFTATFQGIKEHPELSSSAKFWASRPPRHRCFVPKPVHSPRLPGPCAPCGRKGSDLSWISPWHLKERTCIHAHEHDQWTETTGGGGRERSMGKRRHM